MKPTFLLPLAALLASPVRADLTATMTTTLGDINITLRPDVAPQAVANFITLAQGTRGHLNPATGTISHSPYYVGEKFYRVVNEANFKIAQTGSGTGNNSGGPGYTFRDEFSPSLRHVPYVLSMANSGFNTNGSQIFLTGNSTPSWLDDVHTIFGTITDTASRVVIDAIMAAGNNGATITGIAFARTDPAALAFDEFAQDLPTLSQPKGHLEVIPGTSCTWHFDTPGQPGDIITFFRSETLEPLSWSEPNQSHVVTGIDATPPASISLDNASTPRAFYHITRIHHPSPTAPSVFSNRVFTILIPDGTITYTYDASGLAGTGSFTSTSNASSTFNFTLYSAYTDAYGMSLIHQNSGSSFPTYLLMKLGCDSVTTTLIHGRNATSYYSFTTASWVSVGEGSVTISR